MPRAYTIRIMQNRRAERIACCESLTSPWPCPGHLSARNAYILGLIAVPSAPRPSLSPRPLRFTKENARTIPVRGSCNAPRIPDFLPMNFPSIVVRFENFIQREYTDRKPSSSVEYGNAVDDDAHFRGSFSERSLKLSLYEESKNYKNGFRYSKKENFGRTICQVSISSQRKRNIVRGRILADSRTGFEKKKKKISYLVGKLATG